MATLRQSAASTSEEMSVPDNQVHCWACRALVVIPLVNDVPAAVFKCGWCGAINPRTRKSKSKGEDGASTSKATSKCGRCLDKTESFLEQTLCCEGSDTGNNWFQWVCTLVVAFTSALIATIGIFGAYPVLHDSNSSPFWYVVNTAVAIVLEVNIFFNYYGAVLRPAGAVQDFYDLTEVPPSRNCFDSFTYCQKCDKPKPPNTHHCSACRTCVVEMDHHCPYLNNCVGRGNLRHFLLFLFWVVIGMMYAIPVFGLSLYKHRDSLFRALSAGSSMRKSRKVSFSQRTMMSMLALINMPRIPFVSMVMLSLCVLVLLMVGMLCARHWILAARGATYVGSLKGESVAEGGMISNLRYVFGQGHPATWLAPSLRAPHSKKEI